MLIQGETYSIFRARLSRLGIQLIWTVSFLSSISLRILDRSSASEGCDTFHLPLN